MPRNSTLSQRRTPYIRHIAKPAGPGHARDMDETPPPEPGALAGALSRYRRMMAWLMAALFSLVVGAGVAVWRQRGVERVQLYVVMALAIGAMMLVASLLLGVIMRRELRRK